MSNLTAEQLEAVWGDIARKRVATAYLHMPPLTLERAAAV